MHMLAPIALALLASATAAPAGTPPAVRWAEWPTTRFVTAPAACFGHDALLERLRALQAKHGSAVALEEVGRSVEGRPIQLLTIGRGPAKVLLWSQMHGDEPSATPALLDLADSLLSRADEPAERLVLDRLTLLMLPMLNPDGAERHQRRNAQAIDVNRDALGLATPEGRVLKAVRDRYRPILGFNLHDQDRRAVVGESGALATISLLAVAGDPQGTMTEGRWRAKRVAATLVTALSPFTGTESIGRYDEDWSPRAFGDNLTAWGTPVVLIECGGLPPGRSLTDLTRLDYVALHAALFALAADDASNHDPQLYEVLPRNRQGTYADVVVRGGLLAQGPSPQPYRADLAFDVTTPDAEAFGCAVAVPARGSRVSEVGDARFVASGRSLDATGLVLLPGLVASVDGLAAREWLGPALPGLARLGVARLLWHIAPVDLASAQAWAAEQTGQVPAIEARPTAEGRSALLLGAAATKPRSLRLRDVLGALGANPAGLSLQGPALPLAPGATASFLLLRPDASMPDILGSALVGVFLDGRELPPPPAAEPTRR